MKHLLVKNLQEVTAKRDSIYDQKDIEVQKLIDDAKERIMSEWGYTAARELRIDINLNGFNSQNNSTLNYSIRALLDKYEGDQRVDWNEICSIGVNYQGKKEMSHSSRSYYFNDLYSRMCIILMNNVQRWVVIDDKFDSFNEDFTNSYTTIYNKYRDDLKQYSNDIFQLDKAIKALDEQEKQTKVNALLNNRNRVDALKYKEYRMKYAEKQGEEDQPLLVDTNKTIEFQASYYDRIHINGYKIIEQSTSGKTFKVETFYSNGYSQTYNKVKFENVVELVKAFDKWNTEGAAELSAKEESKYNKAIAKKSAKNN